MQVRLTKRIGNELNFTCFCLDIHLLIITYKLLSTYYYTYIYFTTKVDNKTKYSKSEKHCFNLLPCMSFRVMPKTVNAALKTRPQKLNATSTQYRSLRDIFTANHETGAKKTVLVKPITLLVPVEPNVTTTKCNTRSLNNNH